MLAFTRSRAWQQFKNHRRGMLSLKIFVCLFALSLLAPLWSNDQPLWVKYEGKSYQPIVNTYLETEFGGDFETPTDYLDRSSLPIFFKINRSKSENTSPETSNFCPNLFIRVVVLPVPGGPKIMR